MIEGQDDIREALERLTTSQGWQVFYQHVLSEWGMTGAAYMSELDKALAMTDNNAAASQARQIRSGQKAIMALMGWPAREAARLKRMTESDKGSVEERAVLHGRGGYQ